VRQQLLIRLMSIVVLLAFMGQQGCTRHHEPVIGVVPANAFVVDWPAHLTLDRDSVTGLHVVGDSLVVYTANNRGYWLASAGGQLLSSNVLGTQGLTVYPPVTLADRVLVPTTLSIQSFDRSGKFIESFEVKTAIQSGGAAAGNAIYLGVTHPGSGRLAKFIIDKGLVRDWELYTSDGIVAAPAVVNDTIFAAGIDGRVWGVTAARQALWNLPDFSFQADGAVSADLVADDFGVYVASQDQKLYCLDRGTGKIKRAYYAGTPLLDAPVVIGNTVYQVVPHRGLVAINKTEGKFSREELWVQPAAQQVLSSDNSYLYVRGGKGSILALDKATGQPRFQSARPDLRIFATNLKTATIYAATKDGTILAIRPVLRPGTTGELVQSAPQDVVELLAAAR
jgi:outer membrane protein assembly factor BamB